jgi:pimeloyl-ACP methyl ester carboxylesterase
LRSRRGIIQNEAWAPGRPAASFAVLVLRMNALTSGVDQPRPMRTADPIGPERRVGRLRAGGVELEVERRGRGCPLLILYGEDALELEAPVLAELAREYELIIPSPPGFGASERPDWIESPDDVSYVYLDLLASLGFGQVRAIGFSLGGWIALEMASKDDRFFSKLVLVDPYGVKIGGPADRDIEDVWTIHPAKAAALKWFDLEKGKRDFAAMPEDALTVIARNSESFARLCWDPCLHNPKLKHRLPRVRVPTLFIWGENDGIVTPDYGRAFCGMVPEAEFAVVGSAGHYPHLEQTAAFLALARKFLA